MSQPCRLYLDEQQLSAWMYRRGRWQETLAFPNTEQAHAAFADFLNSHRRRRFALIVNQAAEQRISLPLPEANPEEQQHLAESRAARHFPDTPWRCVDLPQTNRHQAAQASLMALSNTPALQQWGTLLLNNNAALIGVFSLPQLLPAVLRQLPQCREPECLVLSAHGQRVRLSLVCHGKVVHSRLLPGLPTPEQLAEFSEPGILSNPTNRASTRPLCLIGPRNWPEASDLPGKVQHLVTDNTNSASLFLALPARHWPKNQYAPEAYRQVARRQAQQFRIHGISLIIILLGSGIFAERTAIANNTKAQIQATQQEIAYLQDEIDRLRPEPGKAGEVAEQLRQLGRHDFPGRTEDIQSSLAALSRILLSHPDFSLDKLTWKNRLVLRSTVESEQKHGPIHLSGQLVSNPDSAHPLRRWQNLLQALQTDFIVDPVSLPGQGDAQDNIPFSLHLTPRPAQ
jgi:hypothetical protein